jgi:hypothetical protein
VAGATYTWRNMSFTTGDFSYTSHHIQGAAADADRNYACRRCHRENDDSPGANDGLVELKNYAGTTYTDPETALTYDIVALNPASPDLSLLNAFCLGCHSNAMASTTIFRNGASGDANDPQSKSWNDSSVEHRWSRTWAPAATLAFSPYSSSTYNVTPADLVDKAYSPHAEPGANERGIAGHNTAWNDDANAAAPAVACTDCHNTHGSNNTTTRTWHDRDRNGTPTAFTETGGLLKGSAGAPRGATVPTYNPAAGTWYSLEVDLCFDCHMETSSASIPKGYNTYSLSQSITDYYAGDPSQAGSSGRWDIGTGGDTWNTQTFTYKPDTLMSSHFEGTDGGGTATTFRTGFGATVVGGRCTPCHDPHGVSQSYGTNTFMSEGDTAPNQNRKFPLLKGNWLTSPYKEDRAGDIDQPGANSTQMTWDPVAGVRGTGLKTTHGHPGPMPRHHPDFAYNNPRNVGAGYGSGAGTGWGSGGTGHDGYFIDDNTWGMTGQGYWGTPGTPGSANDRPRPNYPTSGPLGGGTDNISEAYKHAGLCLVCHGESLRSGSGLHSLNSLHNTVKGVQGTTFVANVFHNTTEDHVPTGADRLWDEVSGANLETGMRGDGAAEGQFPHGAYGNGNYNSQGIRRNPDFIGSSYNNVIEGIETTHNFHGGFGWGINHNNWGNNTATATSSYYTTGGLYHRFSCSKCHSPHAQALPRLMRTNCMETSLNAEPDRGQGMFNSNGGTNVQTVNDTNTNACHNEDYSPSWNAVTPWDNHSNSTSNTTSQGGWMRRNTGSTWPSTTGETNNEDTNGCPTPNPTGTCW